MTDTGTEVIKYDSQILSAAKAVGIDLQPLLAQVPEADEDAYVGIIRQLLAAKEATDLGAPFDINGMQNWEGSQVVIDGIKRMPSDFDSGLGLYLVCDCRDPKSGERMTLSTGSTNIIVQLVTAHVRGWFPLLVIPRFAKKATAAGYTPMHLEVVR